LVEIRDAEGSLNAGPKFDPRSILKHDLKHPAGMREFVEKKI